jgi:hypothetical protein
MTLIIMTLSIMTLSITALCIMILRIMGLVTTLSIVIQHNSIECHNAECRAECRDYLNVMLIVVMLNVYMLSVVRLSFVMLSVVMLSVILYKTQIKNIYQCLYSQKLSFLRSIL